MTLEVFLSDAFVNTLKRDYVNVTPLPDAATVLGLIAGWFEDYLYCELPALGAEDALTTRHIAAQTVTA